ncbi:MAG: hypothetical protein D8M58_05355 [Calditrichaeota bacterium]|nr:MAG: hypothetical protein DWQ03_21150 [Calditrichota bacterium]MBL1204802.1 hypothetical protein [Calditrichota bacterium]NOG44631.1 hypothetical protein [Calditrichota bacterium]
MKLGLQLSILAVIFFTGCIQEPDVIITSQNIQRLNTGEYQVILCDSLPPDAVQGFYNGTHWEATVPVYKYVLNSTVENVGDDGAAEVKGNVSIYNKGYEVESFSIYYAALLPSGYGTSSKQTLSITDYDSFDISLNYWDADSEEHDDDCDCY